MVPNFMTASDIKAGRLVKPFAIDVRQPGRWYLICRHEQRGDARTTRFRDWSAAEIAARTGLHPGSIRRILRNLASQISVEAQAASERTDNS